MTNGSWGVPLPVPVCAAHGSLPSPDGPEAPLRKRSNCVPVAVGYDCCCELDEDWPENIHQWLGPLGGCVPVLYASSSAYVFARVCRFGTELMWLVLSTVPLHPLWTVLAQSPR